jgi:hypothetical protein
VTSRRDRAMPDPRRIRLSRARGWRLPEGAVVVSRPTCWGNPFKVGETIRNDGPLWPYIKPLIGEDLPGWRMTQVSFQRTEDVVSAYSAWVLEQPVLMLRMAGELAGRDLGCWCKLTEPCHADILLALANEWDNPPSPTLAIFAEAEL